MEFSLLWCVPLKSFSNKMLMFYFAVFAMMLMIIRQQIITNSGYLVIDANISTGDDV